MIITGSSVLCWVKLKEGWICGLTVIQSLCIFAVYNSYTHTMYVHMYTLLDIFCFPSVLTNRQNISLYF
jgi:hypothetical protein